MVGLFEYNPPLIIEALERVGKLGKVKIMAFDEERSNLEGIKMARSSRRSCKTHISTATSRSKCSTSCTRETNRSSPRSKFIDIPARVIDKSNVDAFAKEISDRLGKK